MIIKINNIDRTSLIDWQSFEMINVLTKEVDTLSFSLKVHSGKTYVPEIGEEVEVFEDEIKVYGGYIAEFERKINGKIKRYDIFCKDYHYALDRKLVVKSYSNQYAGDIVKDIIDNFTVGFTTVNVSLGQKINTIQFNYEQVSRAIQQVAERVNWDWYVDENKDVHFFNKEANEAPFELNDDDGKFFWNSVQFNTNINQVKNSIFIRGGTEALGPRVFTEKGDGAKRAFSTHYEMSNLTVKKGEDIQVLGQDGIDDPASPIDVLYNPNRAIIIFRDDNKPADGVNVEISGNAFMPVIVHIEDAGSIAKYGEFQFRIIDKSISSNVEAKQRALAELERYKSDMNEFVFRTKEDGLKVGQKLKLNSDYWGIVKDFVINRIITKIVKPTTNEKEHIVTLIGSEQIGIIDILSRMLVTDPNKNIEIFENEILSKYKLISETCGIVETILKKSHETISEIALVSENIRKEPWGIGVAPTWVLAHYAPPIDEDDPKRPIWLDRGAWVY